MLRVIAARQRTLGCLFTRGRQQLAHLQRHQAAVLVLTLLEQVSRARDNPDALREWRVTPRRERPVCSGQPAIELRRRQGGELPERLAGRRIDRCYHGSARERDLRHGRSS